MGCALHFWILRVSRFIAGMWGKGRTIKERMEHDKQVHRSSIRDNLSNYHTQFTVTVAAVMAVTPPLEPVTVTV
jgi:hypothetical protein